MYFCNIWKSFYIILQFLLYIKPLQVLFFTIIVGQKTRGTLYISFTNLKIKADFNYVISPNFYNNLPQN